MPEKTLRQIICDQVVNDYFTPNIKAEVILDTLLTPYIKQMLKAQLNIDDKVIDKRDVDQGYRRHR